MKPYDYYKFLQVDPSAEPEIIELAYKKLAKKYHPDVAKEEFTLEKMRLINEAYGVLKHFESRKEYDLLCQMRMSGGLSKKNRNELPSIDTKHLINGYKCLYDYLSAIRTKRYAEAYELVAPMHKENMTLRVFKNWQHWVSKVYELKEVQVFFKEIKKSEGLIITFDVEVLEYNHVMEHFEKDVFTKQVGNIDGRSYVYLDQIEVFEVMRRFEKLAKLKGIHLKPGFSKKYRSHKDYKNIFFAQLNQELERFIRYSTPFSLAFFSIQMDENENGILRTIQEILRKNSRFLDRFILLDSTTVMVLLPGTVLEEGSMFVEKISEILAATPDFTEHSFSLKRVVVENEIKDWGALRVFIDNQIKSLKQS